MLEIAHAVLFDSLVTLDQTRYGHYLLSLQVEREDGTKETVPIATDTSFDLHDELNEWLWGFSKFGTELMTVKKTNLGEQFSPVSPYG